MVPKVLIRNELFGRVIEWQLQHVGHKPVEDRTYDASNGISTGPGGFVLIADLKKGVIAWRRGGKAHARVGRKKCLLRLCDVAKCACR